MNLMGWSRRIFTAVCFLVLAVFSASAQGQGFLRRLGDQMRARRATAMGALPSQASPIPQQQVPGGPNSGVIIDPRGAEPGFGGQTQIRQQSFDVPSKPTLGIIAKELPNSETLQVERFLSHSLADEAGLRVGDEILSINGQRTRSLDSFAEYLNTLMTPNARREVVLKIRRSGRVGDVAVPVVDKPRSLNGAAVTPIPAIEPAQVQDHATLGMRVDSADAVRGVIVRQIAPGSPAASAGIREGDRIIAIDGRLVRDTRGLATRISELQSDQNVAVQFVRGESILSAKLNMGVVKDVATTAANLEPLAEPNSTPLPAPLKNISGFSILQSPPGNDSKPVPKPFTPSSAPMSQEQIDPFDLGDDEPVDSETFGSGG